MHCSTCFYCCECSDGPQNTNLSPACTSCHHRVCCTCKTENVPVTAGRNFVRIETAGQTKWPGNFAQPTPMYLMKNEEGPKVQPLSSFQRVPPQTSHQICKHSDLHLSASTRLNGKQEHEIEPPPFRTPRKLDELLDDDEGENSIFDNYCTFEQDGDSTRGSPPSDSTNASVGTRTTYCGRTDSEDSDIDMLSESETDYDCSTCAGSPSDTENHWIERIISPMTRHIVDRIMNGLHFIFDTKSGIITCTSDGSTSSASPSSNFNSGQGSSASGASNAGSKRSQGDGGDGDSLSPGDNSDNNRGKRPKRNPTSPNSEDGHSLKYACPYFKRKPQRYKQRRSCAGPGWPDIHRVK